VTETYIEKRKKILTESDIHAIVNEIEQRRILHICRYDVEPEHMEKLLKFVDTFYEGAVETRKAFKATVIKVVVWGSIAAVLIWLGERFKWLKPILRFLNGTAQ